MGLLEDATAELKQARVDLAKIRKEQTDTRTALATSIQQQSELIKTQTERIAALEKIIADGGGSIPPEVVAAFRAELDGAKADLAAFDEDIPDAPPVEPPPA